MFRKLTRSAGLSTPWLVCDFGFNGVCIKGLAPHPCPGGTHDLYCAVYLPGPYPRWTVRTTKACRYCTTLVFLTGDGTCCIHVTASHVIDSTHRQTTRATSQQGCRCCVVGTPGNEQYDLRTNLSSSQGPQRSSNALGARRRMRI